MGVPLNKVPPGLLDFFGIKSGEWGPRELGQQLSPTMDLSRWYLDNYALQVACVVPTSPLVAATNGTAMGISSTTPVDLISAGGFSVPQTEVWLMLEMMVWWNFTNDAGLEASFFWSVGGMPCPGRITGFTTSNAANQRWGYWCLAQPMWARPGDVISLNCAGFTRGAAGSVDIQAVPPSPRLRIARFRA